MYRVTTCFSLQNPGFGKRKKLFRTSRAKSRGHQMNENWSTSDERKLVDIRERNWSTSGNENWSGFTNFGHPPNANITTNLCSYPF